MSHAINKEIPLAASAARAEATYNYDFKNYRCRGGVFVLDWTVESGTATVDMKVQTKDRLSGKYVDIPGAALAQKSGIGTFALNVYPGIAETANVSVSDVLGEDVRVVVTVGGTSVLATYTLSVKLVV